MIPWRQSNTLNANGKMNYLFLIAVFSITLFLYINTMSPTVPPYRDSGELITVIDTLGVAHPPGYPLYTILGKLFSFLPVGSVAFRINLFSSVCVALTVIFLIMTILELNRSLFRNMMKSHRIIPAVSAGLLFGFSYLFWYLYIVAEMYTLDSMFITLLLFLLICLTVSSRKDLSIAPCLWGLFISYAWH
jgi:hypothetical protein